jgi:hypothetical protein
LFIALIIGSASTAHADEIFAIGPTTGWSIRQLSIQPDGGPQLDISYQFVELGVTAQVYGLRKWVGLRVSGGVALFQNMSLEKKSQPARYSQQALWAELAPVFTYTWNDVGIHVGAGISFIHYFEGCVQTTNSGSSSVQSYPCRNKDEEGFSRVAAQEMLQIPVFLGATIDLGGTLISPEFGAAYGIWYGTEAPDVRDGLEAGTMSAENLDFWLRVNIRFPLL